MYLCEADEGDLGEGMVVTFARQTTTSFLFCCVPIKVKKATTFPSKIAVHPEADGSDLCMDDGD